MTEEAPLNPTALASYSDLFFRLLDPAVLLDGETLKILELNDAAERALGEATPDLKGRTFLDWIPEETRAAFQQQARVTLRRYHPREYETWIFSEPGNPGKKRLFRCGLCQLLGKEDPNAPPLLQIIAQDITAQREAEEKAEEYLKKLEEALSELRVVNNQLEELSVTDELTQVNNVRFFKKRLESEHLRSERFSRPYSLIFFDIDNFKHYNDRNGHPAGDELLRVFAHALKKTCRETDCIARYGGEEFVILAPETTEHQGAAFAERLRQIILSTAFEHGEHQPLGKISASIGVATYPEAGKDPEALLQAADAAMYRSKKTGKNRVTLFSEL